MYIQPLLHSITAFIKKRTELYICGINFTCSRTYRFSTNSMSQIPEAMLDTVLFILLNEPSIKTHGMSVLCI